LGAGAVVLAAGAFLLGRGTAHPATTSVPTATALSALTSATATPANASCGAPGRVAAGTLKSVSGSTLTVTTPKGTTVTVKTDSNTKVTKVVKAGLGDVTVGATVAVHGSAGASATIAADQVAVVPAAVRPGAAGGQFGPRKPAGGFAVGTVQSVSGSSFTVTAGGTTITVTTTSSTSFSKTVSAGVSDLTIGQPIAVGGTPNSDGSITAANIEQAGAGTGIAGRLPGNGFRFGPGPGRGRPPGAPATTVPSGPATTVPSGSP
jgi:hypothetical protein